MAREKDGYRDNLEILNDRYPNHDMLSFLEVKEVMGWTDTRTVKKYLGKHIVCQRISKAALAKFMCG
jgi:hypothetical protein